MFKTGTRGQELEFPMEGMGVVFQNRISLPDNVLYEEQVKKGVPADGRERQHGFNKRSIKQSH